MFKKILLVIYFTSFGFAGQLHAAYIDPGTGSYVAQLAIAAVAGGLYFLKTSWGKVKLFFGKLFNRSEK